MVWYPFFALQTTMRHLPALESQITEGSSSLPTDSYFTFELAISVKPKRRSFFVSPQYKIWSSRCETVNTFQDLLCRSKNTLEAAHCRIQPSPFIKDQQDAEINE